MIKEGSVIAVAGIRRFVLASWAVFCLLVCIGFVIFGIAKLIGLFTALGISQTEGMTLAEDANAKITTHVFSIVVISLVAYAFYRFFKRATAVLATPFSEDIKQAAEVVNTFESNTRSGIADLKQSVKTAIDETKKQ